MSRENLPLLVSIKERYRLNRPGSLKETFHIVLDLKNTPMEYEVGDCIGIYPSNSSSYTFSLIQKLKADGNEIISDREKNTFTLSDFLEKKANLDKGTKKLLELIRSNISGEKKTLIDTLLSPSEKERLKYYLETKHVLEILREFSEVFLTPQQFCETLSPMLPRYYSIASSRHAVGPEVHLTVAVSRYQTEEQERIGLCSHFLCYEAPLNVPSVPIFLHKAREFILSETALQSPLIMIGPGTGIAPFRGFMQERILKGSSQKNWLFFGERNRSLDFYYEEYWAGLVEQNQLRLEVAFSRDQPHKIYVQHKMLESAANLWKWIQDGAYIFVCGDASRMAKDVDATLQQIAKEQGLLSEEGAFKFIKDLRKEKRYLRDVY